MDPTPIVGALSRTTPADAAGSSPAKAAEGFRSALVEAVDTLDRLQQQADVGAAQLATGEAVELHDVMLAQERASLSLELAVQVRNKLVEAYQEIMRMQI